MLTRRELLDEAQKQKAALATIGVWRNGLFILTSTLLALSYFAFRGHGTFPLGVLASSFAGVSFLLLLLVNLSIRNGHRNVERLLASLEMSAPESESEPKSELEPGTKSRSELESIEKPEPLSKAETDKNAPQQGAG